MYGMPDTTTSNGRRIPLLQRRSNLLLVLAAISVTFMLFAPHLVSAQGGGGQDEDAQNCTGATVVETFSGNTTQDTQPFDISFENWQVVVSTEPAGGQQTLPFTSVDVIENQSLSTIESQDFENGDGGIINVQGSGTYILGIITDLQSYDITVQECGQGGAVSLEAPPPPVSEDPEDLEDEASAVQTPPTGGPPLSILAAGLLWTGVLGVMLSRRFAR
jgi:hypothetical protein